MNPHVVQLGSEFTRRALACRDKLLLREARHLAFGRRERECKPLEHRVQAMPRRPRPLPSHAHMAPSTPAASETEMQLLAVDRLGGDPGVANLALLLLLQKS